MTKVKSLLDGIGNEAITEKYYDDWALNYDQTLKDWNYKTPLKAANIISKIKDNIRSNLDLACGTGMFAAKLLKKYPNNPEISNFVGYTLVDRNVRLDEGIKLIRFAVSKEPQNGFFLDSLGWAFYKLNDFIMHFK